MSVYLQVFIVTPASLSVVICYQCYRLVYMLYTTNMLYTTVYVQVLYTTPGQRSCVINSLALFCCDVCQRLRAAATTSQWRENPAVITQNRLTVCIQCSAL